MSRLIGLSRGKSALARAPRGSSVGARWCLDHERLGSLVGSHRFHPSVLKPTAVAGEVSWGVGCLGPNRILGGRSPLRVGVRHRLGQGLESIWRVRPDKVIVGLIVNRLGHGRHHGMHHGRHHGMHHRLHHGLHPDRNVLGRMVHWKPISDRRLIDGEGYREYHRVRKRPLASLRSLRGLGRLGGLGGCPDGQRRRRQHWERLLSVSDHVVSVHLVSVESAEARPDLLVRIQTTSRFMDNWPIVLIGLRSPADLTGLVEDLVVTTPEASM